MTHVTDRWLNLNPLFKNTNSEYTLLMILSYWHFLIFSETSILSIYIIYMNILLKIHDSSDDYDFVKVMVHLNFFFFFFFS